MSCGCSPGPTWSCLTRSSAARQSRRPVPCPAPRARTRARTARVRGRRSRAIPRGCAGCVAPARLGEQRLAPERSPPTIVSSSSGLRPAKLLAQLARVPLEFLAERIGRLLHPPREQRVVSRTLTDPIRELTPQLGHFAGRPHERRALLRDRLLLPASPRPSRRARAPSNALATLAGSTDSRRWPGSITSSTESKYRRRAARNVRVARARELECREVLLDLVAQQDPVDARLLSERVEVHFSEQREAATRGTPAAALAHAAKRGSTSNAAARRDRRRTGSHAPRDSEGTWRAGGLRWRRRSRARASRRTGRSFEGTCAAGYAAQAFNAAHAGARTRRRVLGLRAELKPAGISDNGEAAIDSISSRGSTWLLAEESASSSAVRVSPIRRPATMRSSNVRATQSW